MSENRDAGRLTVRTVEIPDRDDLLAGLPRPDVVAWVRRGAGLAGWGEAARVTLPSGDDRFTAGEKWLRSLFDAAEVDDQVRVRGTGPVAFGTFTFDASSDGSALIIPQALLGRDGAGRAWLTTVSHPDVTDLDEAGLDEAGLADADLDEADLAGAVVPERAPTAVRWHDGSVSAAHYEIAVARAVAAIKADAAGLTEAGAAGLAEAEAEGYARPLQKVVLSRDLYATAAEPIDARVLLRRLAARYPDCYTFACDGLVGATPELLIRRDGREVSALVLAGTTPRGGSAARDAALGAELLADAKNTEEHAYAVASIRDTLGPLCQTLDIEPRPVLITLPNLQHLGTHVRGTLAKDKSALALAAAVHPTAAVCGTPTGTAMELIRELEQMDRERYAGPVGWVDADGNGEWCIALRCAQLNGNTAHLWAGGGIVSGSVPHAELAEAQVKLRPVHNALEG